MAALTIDSLLDVLTEWRKILPGDTPIAHALDDEGNNGELLGEVQVGFLVPQALRVVVLWPLLAEVQL
jgi:hypothetical protein